ncbi:MAG: flagellar basal-body rod protein FlgF [Alphaproteobacteria bacterium]
MENTVLAVISQQIGARRQMDVIANNIANANTIGFKSERMLFTEYLQDIGDGQTIAFVKDAAVVRNFSDGPIIVTGNPLDVAIRGEGFFQVETADGIRYTRNGRLRLDADGALVTSNGYAVLSKDEFPILTIPGDTQITIAADGTVSSESGELGTLTVVAFANPYVLRKLGNGLYEADVLPDRATDATVVQGAVENSNVEPIIEMTRMISLLRSYQSSQTLANQEHDLRRRAISVLGSVSKRA